jgi:hypothetical protein
MKESFGHMMSHAISDYFHFDDQFFHTLKPLFFEPGKLTNEYMAGHRAHYLHPVKMYIFISIVYFLLLFQSGFQPVKVQQTDDKTNAAAAKAIDSAANDPEMPAYEKNLLHNTATNLKTDTVKKYSFIVPATKDTSYGQYLASQKKLPEIKQDGWFMRLYNKKAYDYKKQYGTRAKEVVVEQFQHNMPKMMFLMLPLCALILMVAFWNNRKYYVEYLIYTLHLHCFIFSFLAIIMLLELILPNNVWIIQGFNWIATIVIAWYIYRSLRVVYNRSPWRTITKMLGATAMYMIAFTICLILVFCITALTT